jgi:hypothetical protein
MLLARVENVFDEDYFSARVRPVGVGARVKW